MKKWYKTADKILGELNMLNEEIGEKIQDWSDKESDTESESAAEKLQEKIADAEEQQQCLEEAINALEEFANS